MEPVDPVQKNIYQSNTYSKDLTWLHFDDDPSIHEKQQMNNQQSCISVKEQVLHVLHTSQTYRIRSG